MHSMRRAALVLLASLAMTGCALLRSQDATTSAYVGDSAITVRVQTALIKDPRVEAREIEVQTHQGRVTLNGIVNSAAMEQRAVSIARATPGVRTIDDKLKVMTAQPAASISRPPNAG